MKAPAIDPAGHAGVAASAALTLRRRWRAVLGALLLASTPGLANAAEEWPTAPDRGARSETRIPWLRFSGDPTAPVVVAEPGHAVYAHDVVVVREQGLSRRQRRLLRRAQRHAEKAADLRAKAGSHGHREAYTAMVVPVVHAAPPRQIVVRPARSNVHVVRLEQAHDRSDDCPGKHVEARRHEDAAEAYAHMPVVIDGAKISADVERQVARALREVERAQERAGREQERAERARERSQRDAERGRR